MNDRWRKARLRLRPPLLLLAVGLLVWACEAVHGESRARLVNNGYEGVVVGISPSVREEDGPALVETLKKVLAETSRGLYDATEHRAYFRSVTILIPRSWSSVNVTHHAGSESFQNSDIRIDDMHPVYRHQPYTEQNGGCGDPGLYIHLTPAYLLEDSEAYWWGPRDKALLLEWAKLRWGVFDEIGYDGDPTFPLTYRDSRERISPTLCANAPVNGIRMNRKDRNTHNVVEDSGPDEQCCFVPYRKQTASSSLLSYLSIMSEKIVYFCGGRGREHNAEAPTKQNLYCNRRSAWDVISSHEDFKDRANPPTGDFRGVTVRVVQQADTAYALVLDYSGSMNTNNRVQKLRETARRWLLHDVATGSYVAIINFSSNARLVRGMTRITDAASRKVLADAISTNGNGSTSIGSGLRMAAKTVLVNKRNPVILLITDGEENEDPRIQDVKDDVVTSGARVVTVAFGADADPNLEQVAQLTGGKTFTVMDIDKGQMLEDAFQGALTFQPPPSAEAQTVAIQEMEYHVRDAETSSSFSVDFTVGRNLTLWLKTDPQSSSSLTNLQANAPPLLIDPDGHLHTNAKFDTDSSSWTLVVPLAQEGKWSWKVGLSGQKTTSVRVRVTSQPRDPKVHPIITRAWLSKGANDVNAAVDKVVIYAKVEQGNKPVVNADVKAIVTSPNEQDPPDIYKLLDNGQGADTLAGDGIYSRYMTKYPSPGRYSVKAQVTDGGTALINEGFLTASRRKRDAEKKTEEGEGGKEEEEEEEEMDDSYTDLFLRRQPVCCGSFIPVSQDAHATGSFNRTTSGGSLKVTKVPQGDVLAPARVRDLKVQLGVGEVPDSLPSKTFVSLNWTAPGDDMDSGIVSGYELRMATNKSDLLEENFSFDSSSNSTSSSHVVDLSDLYIHVEGGTLLRFNLSLTLTSPTTYFALRAWDDAHFVSNVSNIASLYLNIAPSQDGWNMPTWAVVVVVLVALCLICLVVVVVMLCRPKKSTESQKLI